MVTFVHLRSRPRHRRGYHTAPGQRGGAIRMYGGALVTPYKRVLGAKFFKRRKRRARRPKRSIVY